MLFAKNHIMGSKLTERGGKSGKKVSERNTRSELID